MQGARSKVGWSAKVFSCLTCAEFHEEQEGERSRGGDSRSRVYRDGDRERQRERHVRGIVIVV